MSVKKLPLPVPEILNLISEITQVTWKKKKKSCYGYNKYITTLADSETVMLATINKKTLLQKIKKRRNNETMTHTETEGTKLGLDGSTKEMTMQLCKWNGFFLVAILTYATVSHKLSHRSMFTWAQLTYILHNYYLKFGGAGGK